MNEIIASLMAWTVSYSGYSAPAVLPTIEFLPAQAFVEQVCPHSAQCTVQGYFADGSETIVLDESLHELKKNRRARAMLVHEMVHYLQDQSGRWGAKTCQTWIKREREAYRVQLRYLATQGVHPSLLLMPPFNVAKCKETMAERPAGEQL
ncbi:MAG: hypothetical protein KDJ99_17215 [Candidatus Competibacteraceae bacterium]|nr:hypothetical protein [Candidatus Competibacteraceae bacterium]